MSKPEYAHRFTPCPIYDLEGMEHWLENLALEGLFLSTSGFIGTYGTFEKREPKPVRYRMQPLQKKKYYEEDGLPHRAARDLAEEYGWSFVCTIEDYAIYTCDDPAVRELDTDPKIQSLALRELYKKRRNGFLGSLALMVFWFLRLWSRPMTLLTLLPVWLFLPALLSWCLTPFTGLTELFHLRKLHRKLSQGEPLVRIPRGKHLLHRINTVLAIVGIIWFPVIMVFSGFSDWREHRWQSLPEYQGSLPFSTIEELVPGSFRPEQRWEIPSVGTQEPTVLYEHANHVAERATLLVPRQMALQQDGTVAGVDYRLSIQYTQWKTEAMARQFFRELVSNEALSLGELPTEQEYAYHEFGDILLLQDGCKVLNVSFEQYADTPIPLDQWAAQMADAFLQGG